MRWFKKMIGNWFGGNIGARRVRPLSMGANVALSDADFEREVVRNQIWYRGNAAELASFYGLTDDMAGNTSFWAQGGRNAKIRKIHSGLPALIVDTLCDITLGDFLGVRVSGCGQKVWDEIACANGFERMLATALKKALAIGDGAFKISFDAEVSPYPIIEFFGGDAVRFNYQRGQVCEVVFVKPHDSVVLEEVYCKDAVRYRLANDRGEEVLGAKPADVEHGLSLNLAVPLIFDDNPKAEGRGKSIFDSKIGAFDALDEIISQWVDALRDGRVQKYVPVGLLPRNPHNGALQIMGSFETRFVQTEMDLAEGADNSIKVVQPAIDTHAYEASYSNFLMLALQGIIAPATLGIDIKRGENATAQREREKATLYTRSKIIDGLRGSVVQLVKAVMALHYALQGGADAAEHEVQVEFGEYAAPTFDAQIDTVGRAVGYGIMSHETAVQELYGDTWTDAQKKEEVERLRRNYA